MLSADHIDTQNLDDSVSADSDDEKGVEDILNALKLRGQYVEEVFTTYNPKEEIVPLVEACYNDDYFIMAEKVYDVSKFKKEHPGGDLLFLVSDVNDFNMAHKTDKIAIAILESLLIGKL